MLEDCGLPLLTLAVQVRTPDRQTQLIPFQRGVFQGDHCPFLSSTWWSICKLTFFPHHVIYRLPISILTTITASSWLSSLMTLICSVKSCQILCEISDQFFYWATMHNVQKCHACYIKSPGGQKVWSRITDSVRNYSIHRKHHFKFPWSAFWHVFVIVRCAEQIGQACWVSAWQAWCLIYSTNTKSQIYSWHICSSISWLLTLVALLFNGVNVTVNPLLQSIWSQKR